MRAGLIAAILGLTLLGCGTFPKMGAQDWRGGSGDNFYADKLRCQRAAQYRVMLFFVVTSGEDWETCMRGRGWTPTRGR